MIAIDTFQRVLHLFESVDEVSAIRVSGSLPFFLTRFRQQKKTNFAY